MAKADIDALLVALNNIAEVLQAMADDIADISVGVAGINVQMLTGTCDIEEST